MVEQQEEEVVQVPFEGDLYKKFFKAGASAGFISIKPWLAAGRVSVDIGKLTSESKLLSSTIVWVNAVELAVFLQAVVNRRVDLYDGSFSKYGGSSKDGQVIARVLKIAPWQKEVIKPDGSCKAWGWRTGHFQGTLTATGAIKPNLQEPISQDLIRVTDVEMAEIAYRLDLANYSQLTHEDWLTRVNGKRQ